MITLSDIFLNLISELKGFNLVRNSVKKYVFYYKNACMMLMTPIVIFDLNDHQVEATIKRVTNFMTKLSTKILKEII